ncbi:MAG: hypothetical protein EBS01_05215 [Verrucomicrobia bacterium]|nr:hypothetical protein [Verrucomicrobiota bacterium]
MENPFSEEPSVPTHDTPHAPQDQPAAEDQPTAEASAPVHHSTGLPAAEIQPVAESHPRPENPSEAHAQPQEHSEVPEALGHPHHPAEANLREDSHGELEPPAGDEVREAGQEPEPGSLEDYTQRCRKSRLQPEEEAETVRLLKESLLGGRSEVIRAIAATTLLPWVVSVQATTLAWPEMKASFRAQFLAGLARTQGESAARVRLSLARGLYKVDPTAAIKLILLTLKGMRDKETGFLEGKGASIFTNVLIGRGKAWVLQLPLPDLKPAEADLLVFSALHGAFHAPQAPITQLGILRWAADRLEKLSPALDALILKGVTRWSGKWQAALRKEVASLPQAWNDALKVPAHKENPNSKREKQHEHSAEVEELEEDASEDAPTVEGAVDEASFSPNHEADGEESEENRHEKGEDDAPDEDDEDVEDEAGRRGRNHQRPVYVSKTVPNHGAQNAHSSQGRKQASAAQFNLTESLRQIENHVAHLRSELHTAQKQLRQRDDDTRRGRREKALPQPNPGDFSNDELNRLNQQLELRNAELKARIDELTLDSEERAASRGLITDSQAPDPNTQLQILLGWKLKDDFDDYLALQQESRDLVVQQHYKTLLGHVFEVLQAEGIQFEKSEPKP